MYKRVSVASSLLIVLGLVIAGPVPANAATVVVAPLHDASPDGDADTAQGVTDLMAGVLADRMTVVPREKLQAVLKEQGFSAKGLSDAKTAVKVGRLLKADYVLIGSVFRCKDRVEFAVRIVRVAGGDVVKGVTLGGAPGELLDTASKLANQCAEALRGRIPGSAGQKVSATHLAAERYFLKALGYYHAGNYDRAIMNSLKVIALDPNNQKARLRLAESFLAAGDTEQARITLFRTLQLFPALDPVARIETLLDGVAPLAVQAIEKQEVSLALPTTWPDDAQVAYELTWGKQAARRDTEQASGGKLVLKMPGARLPLDLTLVMATEKQSGVTRNIRLWPADPGIRAPERELVVIDPADEFTPLLKDIAFKHYKSCKSLPPPDRRLVIAPAAVAKITKSQAGRLNEFVASGGQVVLVGQCADEIELTGIRSADACWPVARDWRSKPNAPAWSFMPAQDFVDIYSRRAKAVLLRGGTPWLAATNDGSAIISQAVHGKGCLLWITWPGKWLAGDPRCARVVALAISNAACAGIK